MQRCLRVKVTPCGKASSSKSNSLCIFGSYTHLVALDTDIVPFIHWILVFFCDLPDPLFRIRPEPDLFFQIKIRPDPDLFFKLWSGRNRIRIFFFQIRSGRNQPDPDPKYFKFYVVPLENKLIKFNCYNTIN